jgi:dethiobiotin synthetase
LTRSGSRLPVVIIARPALGTINHTLLTIAALKERMLNISGVIINYAENRKPGLRRKNQPCNDRKDFRSQDIRNSETWISKIGHIADNINPPCPRTRP